MSPKAKVAVMVSVLGTTVAANASAGTTSAPTTSQPASSSANSSTLSFDSIVRYLTNLIRPVMDN